MSMWAEYFKEFCGDDTIETSQGFCSYRFLNDSQVYIVHIYVCPTARFSGLASDLANRVAEFAKSRGCTEMLGSVAVQAKHADQSIDILRAYGMKPSHLDGNLIIFRKEI